VSDLPQNWAVARVGDLIDLGPKNDCEDDIEVGFVPLHRLGVDYRSRHTFETKPWSAVKKGYTHFLDGDVLLARITPSFENGKAGIVRGLPNGIGAGSTEYFVCRPLKDVLLPEYLLAHFKTPQFIRGGEQVMSGAVGQQRVPKQYVLDSEIPLAPLNEQQRIADKLDVILAGVDACRERLDRIPAILKRFRQSVLAAATSGQLTEEWRKKNTPSPSGHDLLEDIRAKHRVYWMRHQQEPSGRLNAEDRGQHTVPRRMPEPVDENALTVLPEFWVWASGGEVVEPGAEIVYGIVQPGPKLREGVPYVRGLDIENGKILENQLLKTSQAIAERYSRASLQGGDILLGIIRATKVAIVPDSLKGANITQGTARFRPSSVVCTKYLAIALEAPSTQAWLHAHYRGIDMPGLNLADVRRVPIPLPPLMEQEEVIRRVDTLLMHVQCLEARYRVAYGRVEQLLPATLFKAFRGDLVSQNPNDEPASVLLERIRARRAAEPVKAKRPQSGRKTKMTKLDPETLRDIIRKLPHDRFTFDELSARVAVDYELLKEMVFAFLGEKEPSLTQVFDTEARTMRFYRVSK
jgi:type I restriction enzyme, S subunit